MERELLANLHQDDDSEYMKADREFFLQNPDQDFYARKRFSGEMMPGNPPNVIVLQLAMGFRYRFPCFNDPVTEEDLAEIANKFKRKQNPLTFEQMLRRRGLAKKSRKAKKGFGVVK